MEPYRAMKHMGSRKPRSSPRQGKPVTWRRRLDGVFITSLESRVLGNWHARFGVGENAAIFSKRYLSRQKLIATIRSREISASIILQSLSQLKAIYKDDADTIMDCCSTTLFLGGKSKTTLKEISELLGKETIDLMNTSENKGQSASYGMNYQKTGKELMSLSEIAVMPGGKCILQLQGLYPFYSDKYDITKHQKYKHLSDHDKKNAFDPEKYLSRLRRSTAVLKPDDVFTVVDVTPTAAVE